MNEPFAPCPRTIEMCAQLAEQEAATWRKRFDELVSDPEKSKQQLGDVPDIRWRIVGVGEKSVILNSFARKLRTIVTGPMRFGQSVSIDGQARSVPRRRPIAR